MILTGRYSGKYAENTVKVAISVGKPRWGGYDAEIKELAPYGIHGKNYPEEIAKDLYMRQLDELGVSGIKVVFKKIASQFEGKDVILCCWENVNQGEECHRRWLAEYILQHTGKELKEATEVAKAPKKAKKEEPEMQQMTFEDFEIL